MATQTLSQLSSAVTYDKARSGTQIKSGFQPLRRAQTSVYIPPNEFRMKLVKRILSADGTIDNKTIQKLQRSSNELQANILYQNGDIGALVSLNGLSENLDNKKMATEQSATIKHEQQKSDGVTKGEKIERPLKLPPIILSPIYARTPRALIVRDFSSPSCLPLPLSEEDWEDLKDCRYLRPVKKHFNTEKDNKSFLL